MTSNSMKVSATTSNKSLSQIITETRPPTNPPATSEFNNEIVQSTTMVAITAPFGFSALDDDDDVEELKKQNAVLVAKIAQLEDENLEKEDLLYQAKEDTNTLKKEIQKLRNINRLLQSTNSTLELSVDVYSRHIEYLQDDFERCLLDQEVNNVTNQEFHDLWEERDRMVYSKKCAFQRIETMTKDFEQIKSELAQNSELIKILTDENIRHRSNNDKLSIDMNELRLELDSKQQIIDQQQEQILDRDDMIDGFEDIIGCLSPATYEAIERDCAAKQQEIETFAVQSNSEGVVETTTATSASTASSSTKNARHLLNRSDRDSRDECI